MLAHYFVAFTLRKLGNGLESIAARLDRAAQAAFDRGDRRYGVRGHGR